MNDMVTIREEDCVDEHNAPSVDEHAADGARVATRLESRFARDFELRIVFGIDAAEDKQAFAGIAQNAPSTGRKIDQIAAVFRGRGADRGAGFTRPAGSIRARRHTRKRVEELLIGQHELVDNQNAAA